MFVKLLQFISVLKSHLCHNVSWQFPALSHQSVTESQQSVTESQRSVAERQQSLAAG